MTVNQNLRDLRQISGMTQEEVANRVGLTRQAISGYESGRTQPDLEMLEKLAALYQTDLPGILYGQSGERRKLRAVKNTTAALLAALLLLVLLNSGLILFANTWLPVPKGVSVDAVRPLIELHFALLRALGLISGMAQTVSSAGCLVLAVLLTGLKRLPPIKGGVFLLLAFAAGNLLCTTPLGALDGVYSQADYLFIALGIFPQWVLLIFYWAILSVLRNRRANRPPRG